MANSSDTSTSTADRYERAPIAEVLAGPFGPGCSSRDIGDLMAALAKAQGAMGPVTKDAQNPHFRSSYATLASAVAAGRDALSRHGIAVLQAVDLDAESGLLACSTVLACGPQWVRTTTTVPVAKRDAQGVGSAATYARRYGLLAILGLAPEDDDGNAAVRPSRAPTQAPALSRRPTADVKDYGEQIIAAATVAELEEIGLAIKDLPADARKQLKPIYASRLTEIRGNR